MKKLLTLLLALVMAMGLIPAMAEAPSPAKDIVILYTNDVHCGIDTYFGYAGLASYRDKLEADGDLVTLVDVGDAIQGEAIGTLTTGSSIIELMNQVGYDIAIPGNHEFDYGMARFMELTKMAKFPYTSCNFKMGSDPVFEPYVIIEYMGTAKVAFVGITTPKTITSSTPAFFQDGNGNFIYSFAPGENGKELYDTVQATVDAARAEGADYVVALSHLGIEAECAPYMSTDVIVNTTGIDVVLDGHSHSVIDSEKVKNKDGEDVLLSSTGTKLENIGVLRISKDSGLSTSLVKIGGTGTLTTIASNWNTEIAGAVSALKSEFEGLLNEVVAKTDVDLTINDPETGERIIRVAETNLGDLCADAYLAMSGADVAFVNGGGIRVSIPAGDITYGDIIKVHPFGNALCMVECTGQEILDALEMGVRVVPGENGGFLHVSGLTYEIHTYIESSVKCSEEGLFESVDGEYRVKNVMVGGEPLDLDKTYTMASHNYLIKDAGDGFTMFQDNELLLDCILLDNQVLINYITDTLGGVVGDQYKESYGEGRIVAVPEKP